MFTAVLSVTILLGAFSSLSQILFSRKQGDFDGDGKDFNTVFGALHVIVIEYLRMLFHISEKNTKFASLLIYNSRSY